MNPAHYFLDAPTPSDEEILAQLNEEVEERDAVPSLIDEMGIKLAQAYDAGVALAREHGMQPLDTALEKNARIFGDSYSETIDSPAIPYEMRRADYEIHLKNKS